MHILDWLALTAVGTALLVAVAGWFLAHVTGQAPLDGASEAGGGSGVREPRRPVPPVGTGINASLLSEESEF
jgi:hypothetical protein